MCYLHLSQAQGSNTNGNRYSFFYLHYFIFMQTNPCGAHDKIGCDHVKGIVGTI